MSDSIIWHFSTRKPKPFVFYIKQGALLLALSVICSTAIAAAPKKDPFQMPLALDPWNEKDSKFNELKRVERDLSTITEKKSEISQIVDMSRTERDMLLRELSTSGFAIRKIETDVSTLENRLKQFETEEEKRRKFVASKQAVYIEIIAAMQRIGLNPPPAMLISPHDAIGAVRSAALLDNILPNIRAEAAVLIENLDRLVLLRQTISNDRSKLAVELSSLTQARTKIAALVEEKKKMEAQSSVELAAIQARVEALAKQSESLKDLIAKLETDINATNATTRLKQGVSGGVGGPESNMSLKSLKESADALMPPEARLARLNFDKERGKLTLPAAGTILRTYNSHDQMGTPSKGVVMSTRATAQIIAPASGVVLYAGNFRSYGQLLILNLGKGYHMLIAGMDKMSIIPGQFIEIGEPIGEMGVSAATTMVAFAANSLETASPILYIELRKDGQSLDPSPWLVTTHKQEERE